MQNKYLVTTGVQLGIKTFGISANSVGADVQKVVAADLQPIEITRTEFSYSKLINELNESGFLVYGRKIKIPFLKKYGDETLYSAAKIYIKRK